MCYILQPLDLVAKGVLPASHVQTVLGGSSPGHRARTGKARAVGLPDTWAPRGTVVTVCPGQCVCCKAVEAV